MDNIEKTIKSVSIINAHNKLIKALDGDDEDDGLDESPAICYALLNELRKMVEKHLQAGEAPEDIAYVLREMNYYYRSQTNEMFLTKL